MNEIVTRVILTQHLMFIDDEVYLKFPDGTICPNPLGHINCMPKKLPIELMEEWDCIAEVVFKEFIDSGRD